MITLYITRHGETEENSAGILQGHLPGHLSAKGREQAVQLGARLRDIKADILTCSDLQRCIDTTHIALGEDCNPIIDPMLRERDWGQWTGMNVRQALVDGEDNGEGAPESVDEMFTRARRLIAKWLELYDGKTILAIGHGLFDRVILAAAQGKTIRDIPRMENAEVRTLNIDTQCLTRNPQTPQEEVGATAN